jgi:F0F1-type ATP synthase alpha subunit
MDPLSFHALATLLSIASSIKNLMTQNKISSADALARFRADANQEERTILSVGTNIDAILKTTAISAPLLSQLAAEARACEEEHIRKRKIASSQIAKDQADIDAAQCMCGALRSILRYNEGKFPDVLYDNYWKSYSCSL